MVNNPPAFALATGRPAIVIPDGPLTTTRSAGEAYGAEFLLLEANHPRELAPVYAEPSGLNFIQYFTTINGTHIFWLSGAQ
jgi:hypothetical protein